MNAGIWGFAGPTKELSRRDTELPGDHINGAARFVGLFDDFKLLLWGLTPAALNAGHHFNRVGVAEDTVISMVVFLFIRLRNTDGTVFQGANSVCKALTKLVF